MSIKQAFLKRKYLYLSGSLIAIILLLGIFEPLLLKRSEENWGTNLNTTIARVKDGTQKYFLGEESSLIEKTEVLKNILVSKKDNEGFAGILNSGDWDDYSVVLLNKAKKTSVNTSFNENIDTLQFDKLQQGKMFFLQTSLIDYLSVYSGLNIAGENYELLFCKPVEKKYNLNTTYFKNLSLKEDLSKKFQTGVEIYPGADEVKIKDGRLQYADILNSGKKKIATVVFETPSLNIELNKDREIVSFLQIFCFLILIVVMLFKIKAVIDKLKRRTAQASFVILIIIALRVLFFIFEIPTRFITGELTDPSMFSSTFCYGIVRSPLDLFLTVLSILCIVILIYDTVRNVNVNKLSGNKVIKIVISLALTVLYFLLLRAFGASIRSVVYDSTLKYFKDPFIIPDLPLFVMQLNILLIGLSAVLLSISILLFFFKILGDTGNKQIVSVFLLLQLAGYIYDIIQSNPQGNNLVRILYIIFTFSSAYWVFVKKTKTIFKYSVFLLMASFLSILLLNYYNKTLEKASLEKTAEEFFRSNEKLNEFMAIQTAIQFSKENELAEKFNKAGYNFNAQAFKLWSKSVLPKEILSVHVSILSASFEELGHYDYNFEHHSEIKWEVEKGKEYIVKNIADPFTGKRTCAVLAPIKSDEKILGYIELALHPLNNYFDRKQCYNILSSYNQRLNPTVDIAQLKMFLIASGNVQSKIGELTLNDTDINYFEECLQEKGDEIYVEKEIEGKPYIMFLRNAQMESGPGIFGVALRTRNITVDLFDFFKAFFIHSIIIMAFTLLAFLFRIKKLWKTLFTFRARLLYSLVIISIVPLVLSAAYFKSLVEEKNQEDISYKLNRRALQLERYFQGYYSGSSLIQKEVFEKAHTDLGTEYSVFDSEGLVYSTTPGFYQSTLLPSALNSVTKENLIKKGARQILITESIDDYGFNSVYFKTHLNNKDVFINVNNAFNELSFTLSNLEVDIFLFGSYSFAAVMIILFSSFLSGQISKPVKAITKATAAVAEGDLDVRVEYKATGEINNLVVGFNEMVEKLKKSQLDLAEFERETAWKEMARQVAHEIKNPLTPMKLSVQQLVASYNDKSPKFDAIFGKVTSTIIGQIETLNKIASEFSAFARMPKMKIEKTELKKICSEAVYLFDSDLKIKIFCGGGPVFIMADADHLKRSLINLIRNSIQANAGHIEITILETEENVELKFVDDGQGIAKDNIEKIFDENFTTKEKGMGLGLSMAKKYFESLNGSISVINTSEKGTGFLIILPKAVIS
jgi:two-component system, NtrC family, nitrogen regulation sensor histidine kinase NtrY